MKNKLKPEIIVFAGPNGSGKSTITDLLKRPDFDYINADDTLISHIVSLKSEKRNTFMMSI